MSHVRPDLSFVKALFNLVYTAPERVFRRRHCNEETIKANALKWTQPTVTKSDNRLQHQTTHLYVPRVSSGWRGSSNVFDDLRNVDKGVDHGRYQPMYVIYTYIIIQRISYIYLIDVLRITMIFTRWFHL